MKTMQEQLSAFAMDGVYADYAGAMVWFRRMRIDSLDPTGRGFDFALHDGYGHVPYSSLYADVLNRAAPNATELRPGARAAGLFSPPRLGVW